MYTLSFPRICKPSRCSWCFDVACRSQQASKSAFHRRRNFDLLRNTLKDNHRWFCQEKEEPHKPVSEEHTHFGFTTIPVQEKAKKVGDVFHNVAQKYDLMNDVMSLGVHRLWKRQFVSSLFPVPGITMLDVAGGTGDISFLYLDCIQDQALFSPEETNVTVLDVNSSMLSVGKRRATEMGCMDRKGCRLEFVEGDAHNLSLEDNSVDLYTIAFGLRNCTDISKVLREAHRVIKHGGRFACLEFSQVNSESLKVLYDFYSFEMIPVLGEIIAQDMGSYKYLVESIRKFPSQEKLALLMAQEGFESVTYENYSQGIVAVHSGFKFCTA